MAEPRPPERRAPGGRRSGSFGLTLLAGVAGAALATVGATQPWAEATARSPGVRTVTAQGSDVTPLVLPLALVALAAWGTIVVLRRRGRRVVAVLAAVSAGAAGALALLSRSRAPDAATRLLGAGSEVTTGTTAWPLVTAAACLVTVAAAAVALVRAPGWPEMSRRYDAPGTAAEGASDADLWRALDEGRDPTA